MHDADADRIALTALLEKRKEAAKASGATGFSKPAVFIRVSNRPGYVHLPTAIKWLESVEVFDYQMINSIDTFDPNCLVVTVRPVKHTSTTARTSYEFLPMQPDGRIGFGRDVADKDGFY
jgi:hypothetical protein